MTVADAASGTRLVRRPRDGRRIAFEVLGPAHGFPVVLLHGTPGSRLGPRPRGIVLHRLGIRLITYDRPGYGDSDRVRGRDVAHAAQDVRAIADALRLDRFSVVGRSGGGPHALACAADAALRDRIIRVAVLVSLAPAGAPGWFDGMNDDNHEQMSKAVTDPAELESEIRRRATEISTDPDFLLGLLTEQMTVADQRVVSDAALRRQLRLSYRDAIKNGPYGWIDDLFALRRDWQVDLRAITAPVRLWHGGEDTFAPAVHSRYLAHQIGTAELDVRPGAAHFDAMPELPRTLRWLAARPVVAGLAR
ncbi:alpha/beta fold hydrolase [Actinoplanes teichomyceticus]|uniref:alpha/beta fold hydrolase n=1 Tax=Actinoplanes teichomyceticus TaxID=1867 RepID=UPI001A58B298|nr:alpha/beta hydrolase [Actinoplanes teichomyceticus]GIF13866.1 alpha/beta hydrolase [Actinoplanes teichomyceticus]